MEGTSKRQHAMGKLAMTALAGSGQLAVHFAPFGLDLALALRDLPAFPAFPHPASFVIVRRVVGPTLAVKLAIQAPQGLRVGSHLRTERLEEGLLLRHHGNRRWTEVQAHYALAKVVLRFAIGGAFTYQLGVETVAQPQLAPHQAHILDRTGQSMR